MGAAYYNGVPMFRRSRFQNRPAVGKSPEPSISTNADYEAHGHPWSCRKCYNAAGREWAAYLTLLSWRLARLLSGTTRDKSAAIRIRANRRHCCARLIEDLPCVALADEADNSEEERIDPGDIFVPNKTRLLTAASSRKRCQVRINRNLTEPPGRGSKHHRRSCCQFFVRYGAQAGVRPPKKPSAWLEGSWSGGKPVLMKCMVGACS